MAADAGGVLLRWTQRGAVAIEALAVALIVAFIFSATAAWLLHTLVRRCFELGLAGLALLVLIRTFLSWSIVLEVEGRWPWQAMRTRPLPGKAG